MLYTEEIARTNDRIKERNELKNTVKRQSEVMLKMAEFISEFDIDEKICKQKQFDDDCGVNGRSCVECIIKHFAIL